MDRAASNGELVASVAAWLDDHPSPDGPTLAAAGLVAPHWPRPWGLGASPEEQLAIDALLRERKISRPSNPIGIGWAGPTLLNAGTPEQQRRWLPSLLSGEEFWCQLFSEPGAGSDLAALATKAVRDGDEWIVNGSKVWTSYGHVAKWGILLARTDSDAEKHHGITYFICPMDAEGIEIRPLVDMTGTHTFNEVFFTDVRIPHDHVVGAVNDGWRLAKVTLSNERVSLSGEGLLWGNGPKIEDVLNLAQRRREELTPELRDRIVQLWVRARTIHALKLRLVATAVQGGTPGPEASVRKALADDLGMDALDAVADLLGMEIAAFSGDGSEAAMWRYCELFAQALTIGGGTSVVQRSIIAEKVLGLPRDLVS